MMNINRKTFQKAAKHFAKENNIKLDHSQKKLLQVIGQGDSPVFESTFVNVANVVGTTKFFLSEKIAEFERN